MKSENTKGRCPVCGGETEQQAGPGRPRTYCGEGCRRLAENMIRRLTRRLEALEDRADGLRIRVETGDPLAGLVHPSAEEELAVVHRLIQEKEAALLALYGGETKDEGAGAHGRQ